MQKAEKFAKDRQAIVDDLEEQRAAILAQIDAPDFLSIYFPQIDAMRNLFAALAAAFAEAAERNRKMRDWATEAETLRLRFGSEPSRPIGEGVIIDV